MLTPRQAQCLDVICRTVAEGRPPPSQRELAGALGLRSTAPVSDLVEGLRRRGFVRQTLGQPRSTEPLKWPDGSRFAAEDGWRMAALIAAYESGRSAAARGGPCPYLGRQGEAWRLGAAAAKSAGGRP